MATDQDHVPIGNWRRFTEILGSCNGLLLVGVDNTRGRCYTGRGLLVWNPSTRELRHIPPASYPKPRLPRPEHRYVYGFGYDDSTDDYKIVFIFSFKRTYRTHIYSLRNGSWKRIANFELYTPIRSPGKLVKGRLHWFARDRRRHTCARDYLARGSPPWDLVALDLAKEEYEIVVRPQHLSHYDFNWGHEVSNLGGCLGLVCFNRWTLEIHVWSMTEYGKAESWTKIWARSLEGVGPEWNGISPLWLRENGDIVVRCGRHIDVYNINDEFRKSQLHMVGGNLVVRCFYVEGLVSPFGNQDLADEFDHHMPREQQLKQLHFVH